MHRWGDPGVPWKDIEDAAEYIGLGLRRWGRIAVSDYKEKYGTVRVYCSLGWYNLHSVTHPGYACYRWLWTSRVPMTWLNWAVVPFQKWLYRRYYHSALKRWPHLREEILSCADYHELLVGL